MTYKRGAECTCRGGSSSIIIIIVTTIILYCYYTAIRYRTVVIDRDTIGFCGRITDYKFLSIRTVSVSDANNVRPVSRPAGGFATRVRSL
jgi:hypothetical protein